MTSDGSARCPEPVQPAEGSLDLRRAALELVERGWSVLPLTGKLPLTSHGKDDATTSTTVVTRWWTWWPQANIGVRVPTNLLVLDVDPRNGGLDGMAAMAAQAGGLPATLTVWSGRHDGGRHLYFWYPGGKVTARNLPPGVDLKTSNGYVLVPPSVHPSTGLPYTWDVHGIARLPRGLRILTRAYPTGPPRACVTAGKVTGSKLTGFVERLPDGNRNNGLFWAACRAAEAGQLDGCRDQLIAAALITGLPEHAARATINSADITIANSST